MRAPVVDAQELEAQEPSAAAAAAADDPSALWNPTTCFNARNGAAITLVTVHMMQGYYGGTISWFKNCGNGVSAHYLLRSSDGQITQMVRESDLAWHVRASNPYTIGLEHEGFVAEPSWYTTAMYEASAALVRRIGQRHGIDRTKTYGGTFQGPLSDIDYKIKGHVHFSNQTHTDPGTNWNWARYRQLVIGTAERNADVLDGESAVSTTIGPGQTRSVTVRVRNTGSRTWTAGEAYRLGAAADNGIAWSGFRCGGYANGLADARAFLCQNVPPEGTHDFTFDVTGPANGTAKLSLRMVQDGVAWFGEPFSWSLSVVATRAAEVVEAESQVPVALAPAESRAVVVRVRNTGSTTWTAGAAYRLGAMPENTATWSSFGCGGYMNGRADGRVFLCQSVPPGGVHDFRFTITAPTSGTSVLAVRMVQDGVAWFGEGQAWAMTNACVQSVGADRWKGEYFANMTLTGAPVSTRDDGASALSFDWGAGSPAASCGVPADRFSARWTRTVTFPAGTQRFTVTADDGVRLYVDGALKLDKWIDQAPTTYTVDVPLAAGAHTLRLDYYENGGGAVAKLSWASGGGTAAFSKLTIHTGFTGPLSMPFLRDAKPRLVKILDNFGPAADIKAASPGTLIIGRIFEPTQPVDGDPAQRAQEWWARNRDRILAHPAVDYWEGYNEPGVASRDAVAWYARFEAARVTILAQNGRKACVGNFSTSRPDINDPGMWPAFYPALDAARANGGILGLHEYGTPMQQFFETATGEGWLCALYRKVYRIHLVPDGKTLPLAITETGVDGVSPVGWKNHYTGAQYMEQLRWYDSILRQDSYVLGAAIFALEIPGWESFDVSPIVGPLTSHVRDTR
jgi:N-acetyl-anhydromuramyl-L-alanine amidase AmpD